MDQLFWGFFFLFLNFNLNLNQCSIALLPNWVGFLLLYRACGALEHESELFQKPRPFCVGLSIYAALLWLMDLLGISADLAIVSRILNLAATCLNLYVSMLIIDALTGVEMRRNYDLCSVHLRKAWKFLAVTTIAANVLTIFPLVALPLVLAAGISCIFFLVAVHSTRKAWRNMLCEQSIPL